MSKIKICGLFREEDIEFVNIAEPDFIGFVFVEKSKRFVNAIKAESLKKNLLKKIIPVGVFVNEKIENIVSLYKNEIISIVQLHGNEEESYMEKLKEKISIPIIKVFNMNNNIKNLSDIAAKNDYVLLDSSVPGSGKTFNWEYLNNIDLSKNIFLAGGINLQNIKDAIKLNPFAIDVSSGAETNNVKDKAKILELVKTVRNN